jgi:lipoprotein Spr
MVKNIIYFVLIAFALSSCESLRQLTATDSRKTDTPNSPTPATKTSSSHPGRKEVKFLENIATSPEKQPTTTKGGEAAEVVYKTSPSTEKVKGPSSPTDYGVERTSSLQMKYAILMNTEVENVQNVELFKKIDDWYGTKYCLGGTTSKCIDCSAFMQILFASVYAINLPRTAKDQYNASSRVSRTELKEGDLVFFNTRGGVSHVGLYLQNNKFVHASTGGVTISDLFDPYYLRRFIGVGRVEKSTRSTQLAAGSR